MTKETNTSESKTRTGILGMGNGVVQATNQIIGTRRWIALGAVLLTMFFSSLDQTVISTAMPVIVGELKGFSLYAWIFTAYMMASAVTVPIYGKLSDVYGRKPFYLFGIGLFMIGSVLSGMSQSIIELIIFRTLQGIGAGAMISMPRATIGDIFNPRERGKWMGITSSVFGIASIIGPTMGGWITDHWGWRWVFYINLPVAVLALIAIFFALPSVRSEERVKLDWWGSVWLVLGLVPMLLAFTWAGSKFAWGSTQIIGLFTMAIVFLILFVFTERRAEEPIIAPQLFQNKIFTTTAIVALFIAMAMFGAIIFLPLFVQGVLGQTAEQSGQILTPMMLSFVVGSIAGGYLITKTGRYKVQAIIGTGIMAVGTFLLTKMGPETSSTTVVINMIIMGLGIGSVLPLLNVVVQNAFPYRMMGMVSAAQQFVRSLGGIIIAPILGSVMTNTFSTELAARMPAQLKMAMQYMPAAQRQLFSNPQGLINAQAQAAIQSRFAAFGSQGQVLYQQFIEAVRQSLSVGTSKLFLFSFVVTLLAVLSALFLPEINLKHDEFFAEE